MDCLASMGTMGGRIVIGHGDHSKKVREDMSRKAVWMTIALIGGMLLILFCWDYLWINLIQSGSIDAP